jgi:folylpolyglutamate synthase
MNIIHIAGTKGKGSTCILLNNFLRQRFQDLKRPINVGLYTSPHIRKPTERIRINSVDISDDDFAQYVFEVLDMLKKSKSLQRDGMPTYFRFMTLMAFHYFMSKDVAVAIIEVGVGGEYDSTNIISKPLAVGITTIHLDHQSQLGSTLEDIAWHKAGILKPSVRAFTVVQKEAVHGVIDERARAANVGVTTVQDLQWLVSDVIISKGQRENAALAAHLASAVFEKLLKSETSQRAIDLELPDSSISSQLLAGLERTHLPARGETTRSNGATWFLDGAHTVESVRSAVQDYRQRSFAVGIGRRDQETSQRQVAGRYCSDRSLWTKEPLELSKCLD